MTKNKKKIIMAIIGVILIMTFTKLLMLVGTALLLITIFKKNENVVEKNEEELQVIDTQEHDQLRCLVEVTREKLDIKAQVKRDMDVRQFQGRNNVTIEEVVDYMIDNSQYIGLKKRQYQMERITEVCNLTQQDMDEVFHRIWGKCKIYEDPEGQRQRDYEKAKIRQGLNDKSLWREWKDDELRRCKTQEDIDATEKWLPESKIKELENEAFKRMEDVHRSCNYDVWLKWKGYIT